MKKICTLVLLVIGLYFTGSSQGVVPNAGFETWTDSISCGTWSGVEFPGFPPLYPAVYTLKRTTDKHSGTYAAKITSAVISGLGNSPGVGTLGTVDLTTQTIKGGIPFTEKPATMKFWYKYQPVTGDTMFVFIGLFKRNGSVTDTVAKGSFQLSQTVSAYTQQTITLEYLLPTVTPDSMNIIALSSQASIHAGSTLYLDDLTLEGLFVGVPHVNLASEISLSPNPSNGMVTVETGSNLVSKVRIINAIGQEVYATTFTSRKSLNLQHLPKGLYVAEIASGDVKSVKRFIIK
jgi:hypothetical protein